MSQLTVSSNIGVVTESGPSVPKIKFLTEPIGQFLFLVVHVILAFLMQSNSLIGYAHVTLTLVLGGYLLLADKSPIRLVILMGYMMGAEILWRGFSVAFFYELVKYALSALCLLSILKNRGTAKANIFPVFYFLFLMPSIVQSQINKEYVNLTNINFIDYPFYFLGLNRAVLSFNLSGPFALAVCSLFFSTVTINKEQTKGFMVAMLAPIVGLMALAIVGTVENIELIDEISGSSRLTSAGIGPNQVSSVLGLGIFLAFLLIFRVDKLWLKGIYAIIAIMLATQTMLTFSRGGLWTGLGAIVVASLLLITDRRSRAFLLVGCAFLVVAIVFVIYPFLNDITDEGLSTRLSSLDTQGRDIAVEEEIESFMQNPIFGTGPGGGSSRFIAHTEYSRVLGEHGLFGIFSLLFYGLIILQLFFKRMHPQSKATVLGFIIWASLTMFHAALRLAAPAFIFGAALITYTFDEEEDSIEP